ncbi:hypothetical protein [Streptomyces chrestomyceticus]|uniref:hypothetical protein n=1 Tax=Streptomyces chrestomyceticus TaxID=68185 RepID=UPI0037ABD982
MHSPPGDTFARGPWHELPTAFGALLRPRIDAIASGMVEAIRQEVPAYRRPLDSSVGRDLVASVCRAMRQFAELTEAPESAQDHHVRHFRHLGRVEFLNGRTTDGLQAAFRVGARVGGRRYAEIARTASLPAEIVLPLHEAVLTHINALSNEAVKGFVVAQAHAEDEVQRSRRALWRRRCWNSRTARPANRSNPSRRGLAGRCPPRSPASSSEVRRAAAAPCPGRTRWCCRAAPTSWRSSRSRPAAAPPGPRTCAPRSAGAPRRSDRPSRRTTPGCPSSAYGSR